MGAHLDEPAAKPETSAREPESLADLDLSGQLGGSLWWILAMVAVAAIAFFIIVVCLGVDNS